LQDSFGFFSFRLFFLFICNNFDVLQLCKVSSYFNQNHKWVKYNLAKSTQKDPPSVRDIMRGHILRQGRVPLKRLFSAKKAGKC